MVQLKWKPLKNTERTAISRHGESWKWLFLHHGRGPQGQDVLITSQDGSDLRWIFGHQIKGAEKHVR